MGNTPERKNIMKTRKHHLTVTWYGHSAFLLESPSGKKVLVDPWLENPKSPRGVVESVTPDLILVSHGHSDHLGNTVAIAKRTGATVIGIHEVALYIKRMGVKKVEGINKGGTLTLADVRVTMVDARHSGAIDVDEIPVTGGEAAGYVVEFENGYTVYHAGDTCAFLDMQLIGRLYKPDLALLPIGDLFTMGPREAALACTFLKPKAVIGMHYGTFPPLVGTPEQLKRHLPASMKKSVHNLEPGVPYIL